MSKEGDKIELNRVLEPDLEAKVLQIIMILKLMDFGLRTTILNDLSNHANMIKSPKNIIDVEQLLRQNPELIDTFTSAFFKAFRMHAGQVIKEVQSLQKNARTVMQQADNAPYKENFVLGTSNSSLYACINNLDKTCSNKFPVWKQQAGELSELLKTLDIHNIAYAILLLNEGENLKKEIKQHYDVLAKNIDIIYTAVEVKMKSTYTGTPSQSRGNPSKTEAPELYGVGKQGASRVQGSTLSKDDIKAIRLKHRAELKNPEGKIPATEPEATKINYGSLVRAILDEPNYAISVIENTSAPTSFNIIKFSAELGNEIFKEKMTNGESEKAVKLSHFYHDHLEEKAVKTVMDQIRKYQAKKRPCNEYTKYFNSLDVQVLRLVEKKLNNTDDKKNTLYESPEPESSIVSMLSRNNISLHTIAAKTYAKKLEELDEKARSMAANKKGQAKT